MILPASVDTMTELNNTLSPTPVVKVFAAGFLTNERRLLEGTVLLSQRRNPRLALQTMADAHLADAVLVDYKDPNAVAWAKKQPWLADRTVIWVDSPHVHAAGHTVVKRPVQWPGLPIVLSRAMDNNSLAKARQQEVGNTDFHTATTISGVGTPELPKDAPAVSAQPRVLVVDDSLAVRNHVQSLLSVFDVHVSLCESGELALAMAEKTHYHCILMDVLMPGMDGYETCRRLKATVKSKKPLPVVMLTSKSSPFDRIRGKMAGCDAYLTKPVDPKELGNTLAKFIALKTPAASHPGSFPRMAMA